MPAWQKGQTGNPGGLTSRQLAMKRRLEGLTLRAVDALERVLNDDQATHSERLAAAREVFDRAIGKPKQQATISVEHGPNAHLAALLALSNKAVGAIGVQNVPVIDAVALAPQGVPANSPIISDGSDDDGSADQA